MIIGKYAGGIRLDKWIEAVTPEPVKEIMHRVEAAGHEVWLVGGCVRDLYLGKQPDDYDLTTDAVPDKIASLFDHSVMAGAQHGTVIVIHNGLSVEITTYRSEGSYSDSRRPDSVNFHSDIKQDLARRDFTVNSMAWRKETGLLDIFGGLADLRGGILRSVGDPDERFREDALRMLRAIRFAVRLDLVPDRVLLAAAVRNKLQIRLLSRERIWKEIKTILVSPYAKQIKDFAGTGILKEVITVLLGEDLPDENLAESFEKIISPDWQVDYLPALLWLTTGIAAEHQQRWISRVHKLRAAGETRNLISVFLKKCRLSRHQSIQSTAVLYWCSIRLAFKTSLSPSRQRILLRLVARRFKIDAADSRRIAAAAAGLLLEFSCRNGFAGTGLQEDIEMLQSMVLPAVAVTDLPISGNDLHDAGVDTGSEMKIVLERLLSLANRHPDLNRRDILIRMIKNYSVHGSFSCISNDK